MPYVLERDERTSQLAQVTLSQYYLILSFELFQILWNNTIEEYKLIFLEENYINENKLILWNRNVHNIEWLLDQNVSIDIKSKKP